MKPDTTIYRAIDRMGNEPVKLKADDAYLHPDARRYGQTMGFPEHVFAWGYPGAGPEATASAILLDFFIDDRPRAESLSRLFMEAVIAEMPQSGGWILTGAEVRQAVECLESNAPRLSCRVGGKRDVL